MPQGHRITGVLAALLVAAPALAQDSGHMFKISGFGTLAATKSSEKNADFITNYAEPSGPGYTRSVDFGVDSRVGLQVDVKFNDYFSAVVQGISEHRYDDTYTPYVNMAHLKLQALPGLSFRAGRIPYSAYLISDYQKVGYAQPWVRPPVEVYQFNPITYIDGGDLNWQANVGSAAFSGQIVAGQTSVKVPQFGTIAKFKADSVAGGSLVLSYGHATFRGFYVQMKATLDNDVLDGPTGPFAILRAPYLPTPGGPAPNPYYNPALADEFQIKNDKISYLSFGFNYDPGNWFLMGEWTRKRGDDNILLHFTAGYVTAGVRLGNWTPYVSAASKVTDQDTTNPNPIINALVSTADHAQTSYGAGLRWDFYTNLALKAQFDHVKNGTGSWGALVNDHPPFQPGGTYNLATLALDFVF
ncbi:MAG TPA: hypothetical protein VF768_02150 [Holophagaceae bacterium]